MRNNKENLFVEKFNLLNSQKYSDEIDLATSSSSDYETVTHNSSVEEKKSRTKKRKRKSNYQKNISSLDITINDVIKYSKRSESGSKSPLLCSKNILSPTHKQNIVQQSPILCTKGTQRKSPILSPKILPQCSHKVKKQLFDNNHKLKDVSNVNKVDSTIKFDISCITESFEDHKDNYSRKSQKLVNEFDVCGIISENTCRSSECENLPNRSNTKADLINKVKLFFDSHFSSEEASQNTISDSQVSSRSEELEIYTSKSESSNCAKEEKSSPESCYEHEGTRKVRYKKDGLAFRLNNLLRKRKAHISLWKHERYLAGNSNFVIPKQEHVVFRIQKIHFKYGCYLLDVYDIHGQFYCVLINSYYINETIKNESVLKLYKPYQYVDLNDKCKLIINVCKFEIVDINN